MGSYGWEPHHAMANYHNDNKKEENLGQKGSDEMQLSPEESMQLHEDHFNFLLSKSPSETISLSNNCKECNKLIDAGQSILSADVLQEVVKCEEILLSIRKKELQQITNKVVCLMCKSELQTIDECPPPINERKQSALIKETNTGETPRSLE